MMNEETIEQSLNRRSFLKAAAATTLAATAVGSGAAFLFEKGQQNSLALPSSPAPLPQPLQVAAAAGEDASELLRRLAAAQAENIRLQAQLSTTQQQLASAQGTGRGDSAATEAVQIQLDQANGQVNVLSGQVAALSGLVALYEQLEQIDLAAVVNGGLDSVGSVLDNLLEQLPSVEEGLAAGREAVQEFEAQMPLLDNGRRWLAYHLVRISAFYEAVDNTLQEAVEAAGNFLELLEKWFQDLLKWLPFGIGRKASQTMAAMSDLVGETPATISGLKTNLVQPLDIWFADNDGEIPLQRRLIKPVRDQALGRAAQAISQVPAVDASYRASLVGPVTLAAEQRQAIRQLIANYRQQHRL
jgi:hypothetical protein